MSIIDMKSLKLYADNGINVLLSGHHGVGKTAIIKEIFTATFGEVNKDWLYFSGSTMDAWTNFVGCPKAVEDENGMQVLDIIPPKAMAYNTIKAIFIDEYNRAPKAVRNAVMELLQFKSINGRSFDKLQVVWAAINPHDDAETYDVEKLDPAQEDRFEIQLDIPYKLNQAYLVGTYGQIALPFTEWWSELDKTNQLLVSPRRLDKAIKIYNIGGNLNHVFDKKLNVQDLKNRIKKVSSNFEFNEFMAQPLAKIKAGLMNPDILNKFAANLAEPAYKKYWKYMNSEVIDSAKNTALDFAKKDIDENPFGNPVKHKANNKLAPNKRVIKAQQVTSLDLQFISAHFSSSVFDADSVDKTVFNRTLTKLCKFPQPASKVDRLEYNKNILAAFENYIFHNNISIIGACNKFCQQDSKKPLSASAYSLTGTYLKSMKETFKYLKFSSIPAVKEYADLMCKKMGV